MSTGFRKSLFGFNQDDVIGYIKKLHNSFAEKESAFKLQLSDLEEKIDSLNIQRERLEIEKTELNKKLDEYNEKSVGMERLSENIGKLYLVAQTNAKSIMDAAQENSKAASEEIERNVNTIEETHRALDELRRSVTSTAENFQKEVDSLLHTLEITKEKITLGNQLSENATSEFAALLESVSK